MAMAGPEISSSENTMEALREFLQNMKRTVERLHAGHILAARQTLKHGNSDTAQNSYDFGMLPASAKGFHQPQQTIMLDGAGKPGRMQNWFFQQNSSPSQDRLPGNKPAATGKTNLNVCSSEADIGNALSVFLEDMKKTIEVWSSRYHLLVEGKTTGLDGEALPQPLDSNVHVIDQLDFGPDADHDLSVMEVLDLPNAETMHGSAHSRNGKVQRSHGNHGRKSRKVHFQGHQSRADATSFSMQDFNEVMVGSQVNMHDQESQPEGLQDCAESDDHAHRERVDMEQPGYNNENMCIDEASGHNMQTAIVLRTENAGAKSGQKKRKPRKKAASTPVNSQELTIRNFQYKVEVVESPEWLPKGWITELKTRSTGGSAGSKDKYYFDPVSNRRCRSQKEVFSLIETGKLGRYKRKTKVQPDTKSSGAETSPAHKSNDLNETQSSNKRETVGERPSAVPHQIAHENTAGSTSAPLAAISPVAGQPGAGQPGVGQVGVVNNMFLPYRPGQPSDWLMYDSLANIPRPVLENLRFTDPNAGKSNGERGSTPWPWFLNNSESSMRPYVDRFEMGKAAVMGGRDDMLGNGQFHARDPRFAEVGAKRARKPSKRAAVS